MKKVAKCIIQKLKLYPLLYYIICGLSYLQRVPKRIDEREVIISLASWKARYCFLSPTLDSLLRQRFKVDRVLLWLDEEDQDHIPQDIMAYQHRGIEIRFTKNIGSYKKLVPVLREFPDAVIVTVDDDVVYPANLISNLYLSYSKHPNKIHANRCRKLKRDEDGKWLPYQQTTILKDRAEKIGIDLLFTGIGGVLYPGKQVFYKDVLNNTLFLKLAPKQDDIWFWYMARLQNTKICKIENHFIPSSLNMVAEAEKTALWFTHNRENPQCSANDIALENLSASYGRS